MALRIRLPVLFLPSSGISNIRLGDITPNSFRQGTFLVARIYLGNNLVWG